VTRTAAGTAVSPVRIGISSCLLGEAVRYDGGHKRDRFLTEVLGEYVEWVPVCPEVEVGLGTPRPTIRLQSGGGKIVRLVMPSTGEDLSERMAAYSEGRVRELEDADLSGYVLKKDSPSCGMARVKVEDDNGAPVRRGIGLFAAALLRLLPHLPVEEEGRLNDPRLRENFISRVYAYRRWKDMVAVGPSRASLTRFHAAHKFLCMAHNQVGTRRLGRLLGRAPRYRRASGLAAEYVDSFTAVMRRLPTRRNHTNVLRHMAGVVSRLLDRGDREELTDAIEEYRRGLLPLIVPVTLIRHYVRKQDVACLRDQVYLAPHPHELMLLNRV
jgi:uncharacterized protein YbgA (DUF1722 family)/uncharacterized protein YbbK (DUF523 family)